MLVSKLKKGKDRYWHRGNEDVLEPLGHTLVPGLLIVKQCIGCVQILISFPEEKQQISGFGFWPKKTKEEIIYRNANGVKRLTKLLLCIKFSLWKVGMGGVGVLRKARLPVCSFLFANSVLGQHVE